MPGNSASTIAGVARDLSRFPCVGYLDDVELTDGLLAGSIRCAAVIACSDMGWLVPYVCSSTNVRLFLFQNFGHRVLTGGFVETILRSGIEHAVVYGHSACQYTRFLAGSVCEQPNKQSFQSAEGKHRFQLYADALESDSDRLWEKVGQYNVLYELREMLNDPIISSTVARGDLKIHGWFYKSAEKRLAVFDPRQEAFVEQRSRLDDSLVLRFFPDESCVKED